MYETPLQWCNGAQNDFRTEVFGCRNTQTGYLRFRLGRIAKGAVAFIAVNGRGGSRRRKRLVPASAGAYFPLRLSGVLLFLSTMRSYFSLQCERIFAIHYNLITMLYISCNQHDYANIPAIFRECIAHDRNKNSFLG